MDLCITHGHRQYCGEGLRGSVEVRVGGSVGKKGAICNTVNNKDNIFKKSHDSTIHPI